MPSSTPVTRSGPTSVPTRSMRRCWSSPVVIAVSVADRGGTGFVRQRAISAAVLVPVLLVVLAIGGPLIGAAVALVTGLAAVEAFRLLRSAGYSTFAALGTALALVIVLDAAFPQVLEGW